MTQLARDSALYFPYIDIPKEQWVWRILLYWDRLKAIVPYEYIHKPALHSHFMQELRDSGVVEPVQPGRFVSSNSQSFNERFLAYVEARLGSEGAARGRRVRIHIEKLGDLGEQLVHLQVAEPHQYPWYM